jgi:transmembrane sensor
MVPGNMTEEYVEELIQKYADGTASEVEIGQLMIWYRTSMIDEVPWIIIDEKEKALLYERMLQRLRRQISPARKSYHYFWGRAAALLIIVLLSGFLIRQFTDFFDSPYGTISTPTGKIQLIMLPDGSQAWLNASSTIRYPKDFKKSRKVELDGEAYFEVVHDTARPFSVTGGGLSTTVLGTVFTMKAYQKDKTTTVALIRGSVRITTGKKNLGLLTPETELLFDRELAHAQTSKIDTGDVVAWKKGLLKFSGQPFSEIAKTLERWYGIRILFDNARLELCRYYLSFDNNAPIEKVLSTISELTEARCTFNKQNNVVHISGIACH